MTGCDLRYLAVELAEGTRTRMFDRAHLLSNVAVQANLLADGLDVPILADLCFKVRQLASLIEEQVTNLRDDAPDRYDAAMDVIEKIRAHFHEAVDQRVSDEQADQECDCSDEVREAVSDAIDSLKENITRAVTRAIDNAEAD